MLSSEVVVFTGYAALLLLGACALDRLAWHSHARSDRTTSPPGSELTPPTRPWPRSEAARFHRAMVLLPISLAAVLLLVMIVRHHQPGDLAVIIGPFLAAGLMTRRFTTHLRGTPHGFPAAPVQQHTEPHRSSVAPGPDGLNTSPDRT